MTPQKLISDEEIQRVHANANFGSMTKRRVVNQGVFQTAMGYSTGSTMLSILLEHGLVRKPRPMCPKTCLTAKGRKYLHALIGDTRISVILDILGTD